MTLWRALFAGTMPFWLFTAGRLYGDIAVAIPFTNLVMGLVLLVAPCFGGVYLRHRRPHWADQVSRVVKVLAVVFIVWVTVVGSYANWYIFPIMVGDWYLLPGAIMLPYCGALLGGAVACAFRQPRPRVVAIAVETGVQDTGVAILLLLTSFGRPAGQIASAVPIAAAIATPLGPALLAAARAIYNRCWLGGKCVVLGGPEGGDQKAMVDACSSGDSRNLESLEININDTESQDTFLTKAKATTDDELHTYTTTNGGHINTDKSDVTRTLCASTVG